MHLEGSIMTVQLQQHHLKQMQRGVCKKLKEMGHRIVIITGRTTDFYTDPYKTTI